jgi:hypothetical protein
MQVLFEPLPYEWLGVLALAILWINTLLIAAAALQQRAALGALRTRLAEAERSGALIKGVVEEGRGPEGAFAVRRIEQTGRAMTVPGPDRILFTDREASAELFGGVVRGDDGCAHEIGARAGEGLEVWVEDGAPARRIGSDFEAAWSRASTHKGFSSRIEQVVGRGARVVVHRDGDRLRIAALDPLAFVDRKRRLLAGFAAASILGCAVTTVLACWPPAFGAVSTLGGVLAIAFFLGIQPIGTIVRDAAKLPPERCVGGIWERPS